MCASFYWCCEGLLLLGASFVPCSVALPLAGLFSFLSLSVCFPLFLLGLFFLLFYCFFNLTCKSLFPRISLLIYIYLFFVKKYCTNIIVAHCWVLRWGWVFFLLMLLSKQHCCWCARVSIGVVLDCCIFGGPSSSRVLFLSFFIYLFPFVSACLVLFLVLFFL